MNLVWLEDFLALASSGNFSRAADERHSSQPAFSRRIRALEEWVGTPLFDRSTQPAPLTEAGEWFHAVALEMVTRIGRIPGEARRVAEAGAVTLRIASTHALSFTFLPRWLRELEARTALGSVQLMSDVLQRCEELMQQSKVQFVLSHAHRDTPGVLDGDDYRSVHVGDDALLPVAQPDARGKPVHRLKDGAVPLLQYRDDSGLGRILQALLGRRLAVTSSQVAFTAQLASVLRTMALDGRGVAWLPRTLVDEDLRAGRLALAGGDDWRIPLEIRLYRERTPIGTAAEAFWASAQGVGVT